jgi:hypothetical protein
MSEQEPVTLPKPSTTSEQILGQIQKGGIILLVLLALSGIGIGITDFSPAKALWYWLAMAPVFGGVCIYLEWSRTADRQGRSAFAIVRKQLFHWLGFLVAIYLVFLLHSTGRMNDADAGLVALLTLALSAFFAGLHSDWRICLVGIVLGAAVAGAAWVEEFLWMLLIPFLAAAAVGIVWWRTRVRSSREI